MYAKRKQAKDFLRNSTLYEYHRVIRLAKLTRRQTKVAHYIFRKGMYRYQIAAKIGNCEEVVRNETAIIYDRVINVLSGHKRCV